MIEHGSRCIIFITFFGHPVYYIKSNILNQILYLIPTLIDGHSLEVVRQGSHHAPLLNLEILFEIFEMILLGIKDLHIKFDCQVSKYIPDLTAFLN